MGWRDTNSVTGTYVWAQPDTTLRLRLTSKDDVSRDTQPDPLLRCCSSPQLPRTKPTPFTCLCPPGLGTSHFLNLHSTRSLFPSEPQEAELSKKCPGPTVSGIMMLRPYPCSLRSSQKRTHHFDPLSLHSVRVVMMSISLNGNQLSCTGVPSAC